MIVIRPSVEVMTPIDRLAILKRIEEVGRVCYKSEDLITEESAPKFVEMLVKRGHEAMIEHVSLSVKFICDRGCCYDEETMVLTNEGWKYFKDLTSEDIYYTLDEYNNIVKIKANKIIKEKYIGELDVWSSTQVNLAVTPNHNMWLYDYEKRESSGNKKWKFIKSEDAVNGRYKFNKSANETDVVTSETFIIPKQDVCLNTRTMHHNELIMNSNLFFELVGWWVTDGSLSFGKNGSGNRLVISQKKKNGVDRIKFLLDGLNISYNHLDDEIRILSPELFNWFFIHFIKNKEDVRKTYYLKVPRWFFTDLSSENIKSFLNGVIGGDGSKHTKSNGFQIYTASEDFAKDIVELSLLCGLCANIYRVKPKTREFPNGVVSEIKEQFVVSIVTTREVLFDKRSAKKTKEEYNGYVYCVELPEHHRLYVMRKGKPIWCGNSHEIVRHRVASYAQESTRYCNYSKDKFDNQITFIEPPFFKQDNYKIWADSMLSAEEAYSNMIANGAKPEEARSVLPNSLKTEIVVTMNLREWRHFFKLRTAKTAHPQMREVAIMAFDQFNKELPELFSDIEPIVYRG